MSFARSLQVLLAVGGFVVPWDNTAELQAQTIVDTSVIVDHNEYSQTPGLLVIQGGGSLELIDSATTTGIQALFIGDDSSLGTLTVSSASVLSNSGGANIGQGSNATGSAIISGSDSLWTNGGDLVVGNAGTGYLDIASAAAVDNSTGYIGYNSDVTGTVTVDGSLSTWTNGGNLFAGFSGTANLNITNGGKVTNNLGIVAFGGSSNSFVTIDGSGSTWSNGGNLIVGWDGHGELTVQNGGALTAGTSYLGYESTGVGSLTLDGSTSTWSNSGSLYVGGQDFAARGTGSIQVTGGATLTVGSTLKLWDQGTVSIGSGSTVNVGSGVTVAGGTLIVNGTLQGNVGLETGALLHGDGFIAGAVVVAGGATFSAGNSVGQIDTGDETWESNANLVFEIRDAMGTSGTGWDRIDVEGMLTLNATPASKISLQIESWLANNSGPGAMDHFNGLGSYSWLWITASSGIDTNSYPVDSLFEITLGPVFLDEYPAVSASNFSLVKLGNDLYIEYSVTAVPEPGSLLLASLAAAGLGGYRGRRSRTQKRNARDVYPCQLA